MFCLILCGKNTKNNIYDRFHTDEMGLLINFEVGKFKLMNSFEISQL